MAAAIVNVDDLARKAVDQRGRVLALLAGVGGMVGGAWFGRGPTQAALTVTGMVVFGAACLIRHAERPAPILYMLDAIGRSGDPELVAEVHDRIARQDDERAELSERMLSVLRRN